MPDAVGQHAASAMRQRMPDDHTHGNQLRVPEFWIADLRLKAGGKESKFFLPVNARKVPKHLTGSEDFNFAPVKETIELRYFVHDPFRVITGGKIEVLTRFEDDPLFTLDLAEVGLSWVVHGEHVVKWDGRIVKPEAQQGQMAGETVTHDLTALAVHADPDGPFPGGYVSLEKPPYLLRLTLTSSWLPDNPAVAWTYFHILVKKIELELGPEPMVPKWGSDNRLARDRRVRKQVEDDGGVPAPGGTRKVYLRSNIYKTDSAQMYDNTGFTEYESQWGNGPSIPIVAKIRIADSGDAEVKLEEEEYGRVLGRARFLWDWEDPAESTGGQPASPAAFIGAAIDYYKDGTDATRAAQDHTYPKGDNCHVDRGGKRGPGATGVFATPDGYAPQATLKPNDFPFKTERCTRRRWAVFTRGWNTGAMKGRTGVLLRGSRMAGDDFKLTCFLDYDRSAKDRSVLDERTEPLKAPDPVKVETGTFQIWRRIHAQRYIRKTAAVPDWTGNFGTAKAFFTPAYVDLVNSMTKYLFSAHRLANGVAPNYNALAEAALVASGRVTFVNHLGQDAAADHKADDAVFRMRLYVDFVRRTHDFVNSNPGDNMNDAYALGLGTANLAGIADVALRNRIQRTKNWLVTSSMETRDKWSDRIDDLVTTPMETLVGTLQTLSGGNGGGAVDSGIAIMHFKYVHSGVAEALAAGGSVSVTNGIAIDVADATRNRCVFVFTNALTDTFVHEIGHHLFLPHARYTQTPGSEPGGAAHDRHDDDDTNCTMSYNRPRTYFCGLCQLRLRGWSATPLDKTDANNKKP